MSSKYQQLVDALKASQAYNWMEEADRNSLLEKFKLADDQTIETMLTELSKVENENQQVYEQVAASQQKRENYLKALEAELKEANQEIFTEKKKVSEAEDQNVLSTISAQLDQSDSAHSKTKPKKFLGLF